MALLNCARYRDNLSQISIQKRQHYNLSSLLSNLMKSTTTFTGLLLWYQAVNIQTWYSEKYSVNDTAKSAIQCIDFSVPISYKTALLTANSQSL